MCFLKFPLFTCHALDDDDELYSVSFVQSSPALFVVMSMTEVPTGGVQQSEVVPSQWATVKIYIWLGYVYIIYTGAKILYWIFFVEKINKKKLMSRPD